MFKISCPLAIFINAEKLPTLLDGTVSPWDFFLGNPESFDGDDYPKYVRIAVLDNVPVEVSQEALVRQGLAGIRAQRTELHAQYQKALTELQGRESDLMLLTHTPQAVTPSTDEFGDDIPF